MKAAVFAYSRAGCRTAERVIEELAPAEIFPYTVARFEEPGFMPLNKAVYGKTFYEVDALVFVGACGIAVREIAPYVRDKKTDPAVVCIDEGAHFVIPVLSGHIGGANALARRLAEALGGIAAVTTATDVNGKFAVDEWAAENGCAISDMSLARSFASGILERELPLCSAFHIETALPPGVYAGTQGELGIYIGCDIKSPFDKTLRLIPRAVRVGVGCRRGTPQSAIESAIRRTLEENRLDARSVSGLYSIDLKKDERGILEACRANGWKSEFYSADVLKNVKGDFTASGFVASVTGVDNVCERAAMAGGERLIVRKTVHGGVTVAAALEHWEVRFG